MAKRKNINLSPKAVKVILICVVAPLLILFVCIKIVDVIAYSDYFKIKTIQVEDPSLQFLVVQDLSRLGGRSIFAVNLSDIQTKLNAKYPQISGLRLVRKFPDQIQIVARKRIPFVQLIVGGKLVTLDLKGVVISTAPTVNEHLPVVVGVRINGRVFVGEMIRDQNLQTAYRILKLYLINGALASVKINRIDVSNLSEIKLSLANNLTIVLDWDKIDEKINTLGVMLSQGKLNLSELSYIDLRFKEPIIGKNNAKKDHE